MRVSRCRDSQLSSHTNSTNLPRRPHTFVNCGCNLTVVLVVVVSPLCRRRCRGFSLASSSMSMFLVEVVVVVVVSRGCRRHCR